MSDDFESAAQLSVYLDMSTDRVFIQFSWLKFGHDSPPAGNASYSVERARLKEK